MMAGSLACQGRLGLAQGLPRQGRARLFAARAESKDAEAAATAATATKASPYKLLGPEPKRFTVSEGQLLNVATAAFPGVARLGSGGFVYGYGSGLQPDDGTYAVAKAAGRRLVESSAIAGLPRPAQPLILYEFETCPFCRKVREAVCILDLDVLFLPTPKGGPTWRPEALAKGGKTQFPLLVDPNEGDKMIYESDDIIAYLYGKYGPGVEHIPLGLRLGMATAISCGLGLMPRGGKGGKYQKSTLPEKPLIYWGYELSPFCKIVREKLCAMELPHLQRSCARGSPKRQELFELQGHFQVPFLIDENKGCALFESAAIVNYLDFTYGGDEE